MASYLLFVIIFAMFSDYSGAIWCICRSDEADSSLQKTLDYACGAGADCAPILQNGACYQPNTVKEHCSYAANSYFQRKGQSVGTCDFSNTAIIVQTDPSPGGSCVFPSTASFSGTTPAGTSSLGANGTTGIVMGPTAQVDNSSAKTLLPRLISLYFTFSWLSLALTS